MPCAEDKPHGEVFELQARPSPARWSAHWIGGARFLDAAQSGLALVSAGARFAVLAPGLAARHEPRRAEQLLETMLIRAAAIALTMKVWLLADVLVINAVADQSCIALPATKDPSGLAFAPFATVWRTARGDESDHR